MTLLARLNRRFLLRYRLEYALALAVVTLVRALSPAAAWGGARRLGRLLWRLGVRRETVRRNLAVAFPALPAEERDAIGRRATEHFCQVAVDILLQRRMVSRRNLSRRFRLGGWTRDFVAKHGVRGLRDQARGILFLTAHLGNWELASGFFTLLGVPISPVFRTPQNPFLARLLRRIRLDSGADFVERRGAVPVMLEKLKEGGNIGFLFDQEAVHGLYVPFFGVEACTHKTPAVLARDHDVPVYFGVMRRRGDFLDYEASGEMLGRLGKTEDRAADIARIMAELTRRLEARIRETPDQYLWMHRRWKRAGVHGGAHVPEGRRT
jgi:KDO2-lipid IV(A) lauroyltransferase